MQASIPEGSGELAKIGPHCSGAGRATDGLFIPNFCDLRMVFAIVVVGELFALVLVLTPSRAQGQPWEDLALVSLFVQWVGLTSAALLCLCRTRLRRFSNAVAGLLSYGVVLLVTAVLSEVAHWVLQPWMQRAFLYQNVAIAAIVAAVVLRYFYLQFQWKMHLESETRARLQALQSRIRPHFLFNSMNTIASLTRSQPAAAERAVEDLADLFRISLRDARTPHQLADEVGVCQQYLRIEALRLGERLNTTWDIDSLPRDALLPALSLQPLVENAVYHGIESQPGGGTLWITGKRHRDQIMITIGNTCGPPAATWGGAHRTGNRMAQANVAQRLQAFFGSRAAVTVAASERTYQVQLRFPYLSHRI